MQGLIFLGVILGYAFIGTVFAGVTTRAMRGDSSLVPPCVIVWPILMSIFFLMAVYAKIVDRKFYEVAR